MLGQLLISHLCLLCVIHHAVAEIYAIKFDSQFYFEEFEDAPANFGKKISDGALRAMLALAEPADGCTDALKPPPNNVEYEIDKWVVLIPRYTMDRNCSFEQKVRMSQKAGYDGVIIHNVGSNQLVPMGANNSTGIYITAVFVGSKTGLSLRNVANPDYFIVITGESPFNIQTHLLIPFAIVVGICFIVMIIFMVVKCVKDRRRRLRHRLPATTLNKIPTCKYQKGDPYDTCAICLDDYIEGEKLRVLPCNHVYHTKCIDPWLTKNRRVCPICKRKVFAHDETIDLDSDSDTDDTTPLINSNNRGTQGGTFQSPTENSPPALQRAVRSISQALGSTAINTLVTASDHHSINGECQSSNSSTSDDYEDGMTSGQYPSVFLNEVHVHVPSGDDDDAPQTGEDSTQDNSNSVSV